tara:strand:+ start:273 stop:560 length:288 start_codon:yes stop_codon:yes gene_type:complete
MWCSVINLLLVLGLSESNSQDVHHLVHSDAPHAVVGVDGALLSTVGTAGTTVHIGFDDSVPDAMWCKSHGWYGGPKDGNDRCIHSRSYMAHSSVI